MKPSPLLQPKKAGEPVSGSWGPTSPHLERRRVAVVGGGLVGPLAVVYLARRGWIVDLYDARKDPRKPKGSVPDDSRSINLALSKRGVEALRGTGISLDQIVLQDAIPMDSRMIHSRDGKLSRLPYGLHGECISSVDRAKLNQVILDAASKFPGVTLKFEHRLRRVDFDRGMLTFGVGSKSEVQEVTEKADLILGCDGAYSTVRSQLMRVTRMNYEQQYIAHGYCELNMPAGRGEFGEPTHKMNASCLHIWPRHTFMMIALPNKDCTFTCTLFMPFEKFHAIRTEDELIEFFQENFCDLVPLIGEDYLKKQYFSNPKGQLMCVKCEPHHYSSKGLIIGDASHSMVPFYGQGMNAGFEDVHFLNKVLDEYGVSTHVARPEEEGGVLPVDEALSLALQAYTERRCSDAHAIVDLAMQNYVEMRSGVVSPAYLARRAAERMLNRLFPRLVIPLYTMVSFTTTPYSEALNRSRVQGRWLIGAAVVTVAAASSGVAWAAVRYSAALGRLLWRQ